MVVVRDMAGSSGAACIQYNQKSLHIKEGGGINPPPLRRLSASQRPRCLADWRASGPYGTRCPNVWPARSEARRWDPARLRSSISRSARWPRPPHRCLDCPMRQAEFVPKRSGDGAPVVGHLGFKVHNCSRFRHNRAHLDPHLCVLLRQDFGRDMKSGSSYLRLTCARGPCARSSQHDLIGGGCGSDKDTFIRRAG